MLIYPNSDKELLGPDSQNGSSNIPFSNESRVIGAIVLGATEPSNSGQPTIYAVPNDREVRRVDLTEFNLSHSGTYNILARRIRRILMYVSTFDKVDTLMVTSTSAIYLQDSKLRPELLVLQEDEPGDSKMDQDTGRMLFRGSTASLLFQVTTRILFKFRSILPVEKVRPD
jgi:hypothetical protein